jgi:hydroxyacylglutathione hydrolase
VLVAGFPAGSWQTNCYVVAPAAGEQCVIVDPGQDATSGIEGLLREHRLSPVAVLLTHGHIDHIWSVVPVCGAHGVPAYVHPADRDLLSDPAKGFGLPVGRELFPGVAFGEPDDVREITDGGVVELAGLEITVDLAPGHTPGSIVFRLPGDEAPVLLSGDLLFAGSIGRTDLPGGDPAEMVRSLARVCLPLPDETLVLAGHGPSTTIGRERASNPFLRQAGQQAGQPVPEPPSRGL